MKRFSKFQKISSLVLAFVMILSLAMPYMGSVEASDTNGWTIGSSSTSTVTGNETEGWSFSLSGSTTDTSAKNFIQHAADISVTKLSMAIDLSTGSNGNQWIYLSLGNRTGTSGTWDTTNPIAFFRFYRTADAALIFEGFKDGAVFGGGTITGVNCANGAFKFEFVKHTDGKWQPAINGTVYPMDGINEFVRSMLTVSPDETVVGLMRTSAASAPITNLKLSSVDWKQGATSTSTITGNETEGWSFNPLTGDGTTASSFNAYVANIDISELKITMDLSTADTGSKDIYLSLGNRTGDIGAWDGSGNIAFFMLRKNGNGRLDFWGENGASAKYGGQTDILDVDLTKPFVLEFVKHTDGCWQPAINGNVYSVPGVDALVRSMMASSAGETVIGIARHRSTEAIINNIKFSSADWKIGASSTSTITGNETDGWNFSLSGSTTDTSAKNFIQHTADISVTKLSMEIDLSTGNNGNQWIYLSLGNRTGTSGTWDTTNPIAFFRFYRTTDAALIFEGFKDGVVFGGGTIAGVNCANGAFKFEFVKHTDGKWQPAINGTVYPMDGINEFVKSMLTVSLDETVVGLMRTSATSAPITNLKYTEKVLENNTDGWTIGSSSTSTITGNEVDGWSFNLLGSEAVATNFNSYTTNIGVSKLQIMVDLSQDEALKRDIWLSLGDHVGDVGAWDGAGKIAFFMFRKDYDGTLDFIASDGSSTTYGGGENIEGVDLSKPFVLEFVEETEGNWQPAINGIIIPTTGIDAFVKSMIASSPDKTVVGLMRNNTTNAATITNINFMPKATALGATIATAFEENIVPIKMGFDYSGFKTYLNGNKYETLVNYGAVLVAKEAKDASAMQDALKAELTQGDELQGTSYSDDYTFMFRAGEKSTVPDEYHVVIKKSDNVEYMDKNIWAIGFVVTESWDGTYKYYFTENTDTSRNIENGVIEKSVTELLKVSCAEIVAMSDTDDEYKQTLDDSIKTFNDGCSVDTLKTMIETGLQESDTEEGKLQRELLKYVHLNFSNGAPTVLSVAEYGAVGDGTTDDTAAISKVLAVAQETQKKTLTVM